MNICQIVRKGIRCQFAKRDGKCDYTGGRCYPVVINCAECKNVETYNNEIYCKIYMSPDAKWYSDGCPMNTNKKNVVKEIQKINPLKASKRAAKARKASKEK